jgi:hypothetical protein
MGLMADVVLKSIFNSDKNETLYTKMVSEDVVFAIIFQNLCDRYGFEWESLFHPLQLRMQFLYSQAAGDETHLMPVSPELIRILLKEMNLTELDLVKNWVAFSKILKSEGISIGTPPDQSPRNLQRLSFKDLKSVYDERRTIVVQPQEIHAHD